MKTDLKAPLRFFGPVSVQDAEVLADLLLESGKFRQDLINYLSGFYDRQEWGYSTDLRAESEAECIEAENAESRKYGSWE